MAFFKAVKAGGVVLNVAGIFISAWDMKRNGINVGNAADLIMGGVAFIPGVGWITSGGYFLIKEIVSHGELTPEQKVERKAFIRQNEHHIINAWGDILSNKF